MDDLMKFEGIELRFVVNRISDQLDGHHRVDGIHSIEKDSMFFKLCHPAKDDLFLIVSTFGVWETSLRLDPARKNMQSASTEENTPDRDDFGATVKSQYGRASVPIAGKMPQHGKIRDSLLQTRLVGIEQPGFERMIYLTFEGPGGEFIMAVELPGRGNIILCSGRPEMKILAVVRPVRGKRSRVGGQYAPPTPDSVANATDIRSLPDKYTFGALCGMETPYDAESEHDGGQAPPIFRNAEQLVRAVTTGPHTPCIIRSAMIQNAPPNGFLAVDVPLGMTDLAYERIPSLMEALDLVFMASLLNPR